MPNIFHDFMKVAFGSIIDEIGSADQSNALSFVNR